MLRTWGMAWLRCAQPLGRQIPCCEVRVQPDEGAEVSRMGAQVAWIRGSTDEIKIQSFMSS